MTILNIRKNKSHVPNHQPDWHKLWKMQKQCHMEPLPACTFNDFNPVLPTQRWFENKYYIPKYIYIYACIYIYISMYIYIQYPLMVPRLPRHQNATLGRILFLDPAEQFFEAPGHNVPAHVCPKPRLCVYCRMVRNAMCIIYIWSLNLSIYLILSYLN